ncbi:MAG TPA: DASS family sodium-coupled anion symporter [Methylomirabilota bacterium]|nr:DASS family sodium-coupled anion symporter [Methylomirabilota bacterium]
MSRPAATATLPERRLSVPAIRWTAVAPLLVWLALTLAPTPDGLTPNAWRFFAVFAGAITALVFESLPTGAVGLIAVAFAASMRYVDADPGKSLAWALGGFSDSTVWLIFGAFVFALGYRKSGLGRRIALLLVRWLGARTLGLGYAVALADLLLAPGTPSNTARSWGTIFPIVSNIPKIYGSEPGPTARRLGAYVMWTAFAATAVTSSMFITSLAPNAAALAIAKRTVQVDVSWLQFFAGFAPIGLLLLLLVPLLVYVVYPPQIKASPEIPQWARTELAAMGPVSRQEWLMIALVLGAMFFWIAGGNPNVALPLLGSNFVNATTVVLAVVAAMLLLRVIDYADIVGEKSAWEVFLYFATLLALADGLNRVGFIKWLAELAARPLAGASPTVALVLLVALFFWIHYFFSSLTSHTVAVLPIVLAVGSRMPGMDVTALALLCVYSLGLMGVISPYATGPAPIYFGSGYVARRDFWRLGLVFGILFFAALLLIGVPWLRILRP